MAQIIFWENFLKIRRKWFMGFTIVVSLLLVIIGSLFVFNKTLLAEIDNREKMAVTNAELMVKEDIYKILRNRGVSIGQGLDIANAVMEKSKEKNIPVGKVLGIMKKESEFTVHAKSHAGAIGLMQILPATWDLYVKKMNLSVSRQAMYDPHVNITIAMEILADLRDFYKGKGFSDSKVWDHVLSAYFAGPDSTSKGISGVKKKYVEAVNKESGHYEYMNRGEI
jgi:hypothetical protein